MIPFELIAYSLVEFYALYEVLIQDKKKFVNMKHGIKMYWTTK